MADRPAGARQYIRLLQCLAEHPVERVERVIALSRVGDHFVAETIVQLTSRRSSVLPLSLALRRPRVLPMSLTWRPMQECP